MYASDPRIVYQIEQFPRMFGLRAFPGRVFSFNPSASFITSGPDYGGRAAECPDVRAEEFVQLYVDVWNDERGEWMNFTRDTPAKFRAEVRRDITVPAAQESGMRVVAAAQRLQVWRRNYPAWFDYRRAVRVALRARRHMGAGAPAPLSAAGLAAIDVTSTPAKKRRAPAKERRAVSLDEQHAALFRQAESLVVQHEFLVRNGFPGLPTEDIAAVRALLARCVR